MKAVNGWATHAFADMRLEQMPYPASRPDSAIAKTRAVQPSITEVQLFHGERSKNPFEHIKKMLARRPQQLFGHESCAEAVEVGRPIARPGLVGIAIGCFGIKERPGAPTLWPISEDLRCVNAPLLADDSRQGPAGEPKGKDSREQRAAAVRVGRPSEDRR